MVEISLSGSGEGPGADKRPGLLDNCAGGLHRRHGGLDDLRRGASRVSTHIVETVWLITRRRLARRAPSEVNGARPPRTRA